ncbi:MAG: phosphoribosyltransferase, partial [Polyangiaceae bacterium]
AIPVGAREAVEELRREGQRVVCLVCPEPFYAVGTWYEDFAPTTDDDLCARLAAAASSRRASET